MAHEIVWLEDPACREPRLVGGKAAHLGRLAEHERIPPAFCLTAVAHAQAGGRDAVPDALRDLLGAAYRELGARCMADDPGVAVRSSAIDEDGTTASFAGQHDTFLNV